MLGTTMKNILGLFFLSIIFFSISAVGAQDSEFLASKHAVAKVDCQRCHQNALKPNEISEQGCMGCHGDMDTMGDKSEGKFEVNPHAPHGAKVSCLQCHHGHKPGENYCNKCHEFNFQVK